MHAPASFVCGANNMAHGKITEHLYLTEGIMFQKLSIVAALFFIATATKADEGQKVASKVQKVTVFLNGAQVSRTALVNIAAGTSDLVFEGISPNINTQSIQVRAGGEFSILAVKSNLKYVDVNAEANKKQIADLQASQKLVKHKIDLQTSLLSIYQAEDNVLSKNQFVRPENQNLDVEKLEKALDFQTKRLIALREKQQIANDQLVLLDAESVKYDQQIADLSNEKGVSAADIIVTVAAKSALQSTFTLSYLINNASWYPSYDIRAKNVNSPLTIVYKANISQKTGEDWKNIRLTLSTGSPNRNSIKPELYTSYLNIIPKNTIAYSGRTGSSSSVSEVAVVGYGTDKRLNYTVPVEVGMVENQTNVEFNIANPYTVTDDGKICQVEINQLSVKAGYQYYAAPKISSDVFLTAQITNWMGYNLLSGPANLYFEDTYVGRSVIDTKALSDTLSLSLGVDKGIIIRRSPGNNFVEKQFTGSNKKETRDWLIDIKNRKNQQVSLLVEDQLPVSQSKDIEVEAQEVSAGKVDATTGKVSWNFMLNSQDGKKLRLKYQVKYPKDQSVIVQ